MKPHFLLQWHITTDCEQRCRHCYIFNSPDAEKEIRSSKKVNFQFLKAIADNFISSCERLDVLPIVSLSGGDPILSPFFWDLLKYLKSRKTETAIMGNPFTIDSKVAKRLRSSGIYSFQLSLDGLEKTHDKLRKKGSYQATLKAAGILKRNGIKVNIMSTVSRLNADEMPELTRQIVKAKINSTAFSRYCPISKADRSLMLKPLEYKAFLKKMLKVYFNELHGKGTKFFLKDHLWTLLLHEMNLFSPELDPGCGMGHMEHMVVLADGTVYACRKFPSPIGKVPGQNLDDIYLSKAMYQYRIPKNYTQCSDCELFFYCRGCSAVSHGATGSWKSPDPQCWKLAEKKYHKKN